ncbi:MAG: alcohol dehydrogenase class IV [Kangiellaceae bacterium]|jgi:alcohol dehydrogenase
MKDNQVDNFEFSTTKRIISEIGSLANCGQYCHQLAIKKLLIVTDKGIIVHGIIDDLLSCLATANIAYTIFDEVIPDPPQSVIEQATYIAIENKIDGVIGIGGGSSLDCAKLVAVLVKQRQSLQTMYGVNNITSERCPLILVPTTAGTGSEVTPISIVTTGETTKMGVVSPVLLPDISVLDASLTLNLPKHVTASTGIDAMVHAIEAYTSKVKKNPYSDMLAKQALTLLSANIEEATHNGENLSARQNMLLGACFAGQAFANAPVAAVHALAYPLGGHFHISHGLSNALVLPHVLRFNNQNASDLYSQLAPFILPANMLSSAQSQTSTLLADYFSQLPLDLGLPTTLSACGVGENDLVMLAQDAMLQTRLLVNNPREVEYEDALRIYQQAY